MMTMDEIAALLAAQDNSAPEPEPAPAPEPTPEPEPAPEPTPEPAPAVSSDPNHVMTPDEIAALIAAANK